LAAFLVHPDQILFESYVPEGQAAEFSWPASRVYHQKNDCGIAVARLFGFPRTIQQTLEFADGQGSDQFLSLSHHRDTVHWILFQVALRYRPTEEDF
jgi:hypothetical protein